CGRFLVYGFDSDLPRIRRLRWRGHRAGPGSGSETRRFRGHAIVNGKVERTVIHTVRVGVNPEAHLPRVPLAGVHSSLEFDPVRGRNSVQLEHVVMRPPTVATFGMSGTGMHDEVSRLFARLEEVPVTV